MAGVLGVATAAYLPYCFFNLLSPLISLLYGFTGFRIEHVEPSGGSAESGSPDPDGPAASRREPMTESVAPAAPEKRGFALPSAYTILFVLIVLTALATYVIPAGAYDVDADGEPIPARTTGSSRTPSVSLSTR